ncbi:kynurenine 3-monooxygenase isoform X2 [Nilaparvata lugens]|uniref:kynurenine 3-monooxygenase isoform X2 n=1 Tax=Nilaparvata lugens TaxID=108931 RepID=UPI00193CF3DA|nr:kynurenine 3-monooxygenase isoform X2 [Nilaparvata lugens]
MLLKVGSLNACMLGKRGFKVDVYEYRQDIRKSNLVKGRTINLALSHRGLKALEIVGLDNSVLCKHAIPMRGRMIHALDGCQKPILYDALEKQSIYSVERKYLNELLISAGDKYENVTFNFEHKFMRLDSTTNTLDFQNKRTGEIFRTTADLVIGADGAFSAVRREIMMKQPMFQFSQTYIEHGYLELCIPPTNDNKFAMLPNYLHIWPRSTFMMIALPNQDKTWTVSLFMPLSKFGELDSPERLSEFFEEYFPDALDLIGKDKLIKDYFATSSSHLVSIKCQPFHYKGKCVIVGDAAHAMVPFYGQGMNAGFEDCLILDQLFDQYSTNTDTILEEFSKRRCDDAAAICDLAMYNYIEMRDLVNKRSFLMRKKLDNILFKFFPSLWIPLYNSVTFSSMRYSHCINNKKWQDKALERAAQVLLVLFLPIVIGLFLMLLYSFYSVDD